MNEAERAAIVAACERLVVDYTHLVDSGRAREVANLFTSDGIWSSEQATMEGRDAIAEGFARRQAMDRTSKHVCTNLAVDVIDADRAEGLVYLTLYRADDVGGAVAPLAGPTMVGHYEDTFARTEGGWRFRTRRAVVTFVREDAGS